MVRIVLPASHPEPGRLAQAVAAIRAGGIVLFPTDTLYGLAADPFNRTAVARIFAAKGRAAERGLPLIAADADQIVSQLGPLSPLARSLAARFWPGPLTLIIEAPKSLPVEVTGGTSRVGVRVPAHPIALDFCREAGSVLTATSANLSGEPATHDPNHVSQELTRHVDVIVDGGPTIGGLPSTIVDVTSGTPQLVRAGAIPFEVVQTCR